MLLEIKIFFLGEIKLKTFLFQLVANAQFLILI